MVFRLETIYDLKHMLSFRVLVAQLIEHPPGVRKVMGSNHIGDLDFFPSLFMCVSTIPLKHMLSLVLNQHL